MITSISHQVEIISIDKITLKKENLDFLIIQLKGKIY